jgi:hypothetical protein
MVITEKHLDIGWEFGSCIWAPTEDRNAVPGRYEFILDGDIGEQIIHIHNSVITATSIVASTAKETAPPNPGSWGYASSLYRFKMEGFRKYKSRPKTGRLNQWILLINHCKSCYRRR